MCFIVSLLILNVDERGPKGRALIQTNTEHTNKQTNRNEQTVTVSVLFTPIYGEQPYI
jgi:hypothetical protein